MHCCDFHSHIGLFPLANGSFSLFYHCGSTFQSNATPHYNFFRKAMLNHEYVFIYLFLVLDVFAFRTDFNTFS